MPQELAPHQQRVVDEERELGEKIDKLKNFIDYNRLYQELHAEEKVRLCTQWRFMRSYQDVLRERIAAWTPPAL